MDAKQVRNILISWLTAKYSEIRIYQEKSIGDSICDVMAVTDRLIGFEIKSNLDSYTRLETQIPAYTQFFNENYLVVGEKHLRSAPEKIPTDWGIICIRSDAVTVEREAKNNRHVKPSKQLSILWKLELKNILTKNNLPHYAQKDKGYIAAEIAKYISAEKVTRYVAYELLHRDYSVYDATDYTVYSGPGDAEAVPASEMVDMLSEKDLSAFTLDQWIELYRQATTVQKKKDAVFAQPIQNRTPHRIPYTDIKVAVGAPWIDKQIIEEFVRYILGEGRNPTDSTWRWVDYEPITGNWCVSKWKANHCVAAYSTYGLERYTALHIIEATLNLREIKLLDSNKKLDEKDTLLALEKQRLLIEEFERWIWEDEDRRWLVEEAYNKMFGEFEKPSYDGSTLKFPQMSPAYTLYPYQKNAVKRITENKNTLLAFDVGAGKTYIMIAAAMNMRQQGLSRKNLFVVPNHIVGQWEKIFSELYPNAKLLAIEPKMFKPEMRSKVLRQIRDGDYDGIIMAYSCFEMIPLSQDTVFRNVQGQLNRIEAALKNVIYYSHHGQVLRKEKERIVGLTQEFLKTMDAPANLEISFEDLEISTLFLDEAHNYKNLPIRTKLKDLRGINTKGSQKCLDMFHKVRAVQNSNCGKGVVFATGTPLCNSISDAYAMQMYLQIEELEKSHLDVFDNWVKTFARPEQVCEIDVDTSKYRFVRRFAKFFNLPELSAMFSQVTDFYANTDTTRLPEFEGYTDVTLEKSEPLGAYMKKLTERTENIRSGCVNKRKDNMLKVSTDGRKAALDLTLVGEEQPYDETSKVFRCVENVAQLYKQHPQTTQLIFCDYSTPKAEQFNVYAALKAHLQEKGIPGKEIAFVHNYTTESKKVELFQKFNEGEMRILIGSTFKLGIGANVQVKLKAVHHLDVPWRPADMVQREGRIIRQGNTNDDVLIYRYVTKGSFDAYSWQILESKQKFISQFLSGSTYRRSISDLETNILTYAQVKSLALSQPLMKILAEKENEAKELQIILAKEQENKASAQKEQAALREDIPRLEKRLAVARKHEAFLVQQANTEFLAQQRRIAAILQQEENREEIVVFGFRFSLPPVQNEKKPFGLLSQDGNSYTVELGDTPLGNAKRIIGVLKRFSKKVTEAQENLQNAHTRIKQLGDVLTEKTDYASRLSRLQKEITELQGELAE